MKNNILMDSITDCSGGDFKRKKAELIQFGLIFPVSVDRAVSSRLHNANLEVAEWIYLWAQTGAAK
jgi:hypothetical protein